MQFALVSARQTQAIVVFAEAPDVVDEAFQRPRGGREVVESQDGQTLMTQGSHGRASAPCGSANSPHVAVRKRR